MSMLYYPNLVPDPTWLRQILLVVDDIKQIVPEGLQVNDPQEIQELCEHNLLQSVPPVTHRIDSLDSVTRDNLRHIFREIGARRRNNPVQKIVMVGKLCFIRFPKDIAGP